VVDVAAKRKSKPKVKTNVIRHGGKDLPVPVLAGPVGAETPALRAKYPNMNQPQDLEIVDYYLSALEAVKSLGPAHSTSSLGFSRLFGIVSKNIPWADRAASIRALQAELPEITQGEEKQHGLIKPNGPSLLALVDLGDLAERLLGSGTTAGFQQYIHMGAFDRAALTREYMHEFKKRAAPAGLFRLMTMMELDPYVLDIRWMAYMLATASIETGWTFDPVDEKGKGDHGNVKSGPQKGKQRKLNYYLPVKVKRLPDGRARITEHDGDQFIMSPNGPTKTGEQYETVGDGERGAKAVNPATNSLIAPSSVYTKDDGVERRYFGRGYCQITWWNSYGAAGWVLGRGLDLLFNPELVKDPVVAYRIMSIGMRTGTMFANGMKIGRFIAGGHCDYYHARQMVNGMSGAQHIAEQAEKFERILLASKHSVVGPALGRVAAA
jgi:hypothetical protein